jgi:hypothetical protein
MNGPEAPTPKGRAGWAERAGAWLSEEALTWLLIILFADMFVLPSLGSGLGTLALNLAFTALLFTGLATVASRGIAFLAVGVLAASAAVLRWMGPDPDLPGTPVVAAVAAVVVVGILTLLVLLRTLSPGPITRRRIEGAIASYLLIGMTFALAFELLELLRPGSLHFDADVPELTAQAIGYFSAVTLTTVGYGDVTPVTPLARRIAMLEGIVGQLYPAIIIGWMVSSMKRRDD